MKENQKTFLSVYDSGKEIPEWLIHRVYTESILVEEDYGDNDRWTREVTSIISIPIDEFGSYRLFAIFWQQGLTEYQDNIWCGAVEVYRTHDEVVKTFKISSRDYRSMKDDEIQLTVCNCEEIE